MADGMERRDFLKVLGTAGAGAGLFGCSTEGAEKLIPYVVPAEEVVPGTSTWYRTTCRECPAGCGMNIRTREGRATKAEGNPLSPISHGRLCARGQASLQGLYNPDRVPQALARDGTAEGSWSKLGWADAEQQLAQALEANRGQSVLLTGSTTGSFDSLLDEWSEAVGVERVRFDAFALEPLRTASRLLFGLDGIPGHDFANADVVINFGADFMETWISPVDYSHGWVQGHAYGDGSRGRLIAVTPHQSLTDMNADEWLPARPGTEHLVALAMAKIIADTAGGAAQAGEAAGLLGELDLNQAAETAGIAPDRIRAAAVAFANGGRSLAVGPGVSTMHSAATSLAVAVGILNQVAGNVGRTLRPDRPENVPGGSYRELQSLIQRAEAGELGALLVHDANPLHSVPLAAEAEEALAGVPFVASFSPFLDETSARANLLLPDHHFLESWGDHQPRPGVHALVQPVMQPVFSTKQTGDVLLSVARQMGSSLPTTANSYYDYLRERWSNEVMPATGGTGGFEDWWRSALKQGVVVEESPGAGVPQAAAGAAAAAAINGNGAAEAAGANGNGIGVPATNGNGTAPAIGAAQGQAAPPQSLADLDLAATAEFTGDESEFFLVVYPSYRFYDGRLANRPWLQELPDPVSKISWESWVEVNPRVARDLGLDIGHRVEVETEYGSAELPVWIHPGVRPDTIAVQLGQGHRNFGRYAKDRGVNAARFLAPEIESASGGPVWIQTRASLRPTGEWDKLPYTAGEDDADARPHIAESMSLEAARAAEPVSLLAMARGTGNGNGNGNGNGEHAEDGQDAAGAHGEEHHPLEDEVHQLQTVGGPGAVEMGAAPQDYPPPGTHYGEYSEEQPRWAMSIDMERCIGCSACMTACYAENNIAMVGGEQIAKGRILSWIRIERYFDGGMDEELRGTQFLPMLCQHCGNAPCEPVCPVYASYHTPDGLNAQVYNRCVGTRYCANNCPYKVRYFNYYTAEWPEPLNWQLNPDVTVREKGVMEKCTFCVQRIRDAEQTARIDDRTVADGEIVPACAQTCPGEAIVFGNIKDPNSRVSQIAASGRGYRVLGELNTQSAITYLRKVTLHESEDH